MSSQSPRDFECGRRPGLLRKIRANTRNARSSWQEVYCRGDGGIYCLVPRTYDICPWSSCGMHGKWSARCRPPAHAMTQRAPQLVYARVYGVPGRYWRKVRFRRGFRQWKLGGGRGKAPLVRHLHASCVRCVKNAGLLHLASGVSMHWIARDAVPSVCPALPPVR